MSYRHSHSKGRNWKEKGVVSPKPLFKSKRANFIMFQGLGKKFSGPQVSTFWVQGPTLCLCSLGYLSFFMKT